MKELVYNTVVFTARNVFIFNILLPAWAFLIKACDLLQEIVS